MSALSPASFDLSLSRGVATITLSRPERLNSLTFEVYRELASTFEALGDMREARAVVLTGRGRGFARDMRGLLEFTRITGRLIASIRTVRRPVIAAVNGVAVGAGAVIAAACDLRIAAENARFGFIFPKVGLSGADMGAAYLLPRIVGLGHASELLFLGEIIDAQTALSMGLVNRVVSNGDAAVALANEWADKLARGPAFAHSVTKQMLESEHPMSLPQAIEAEAQAQAICMAHPDFRAAHEAFKTKLAPRFEGAEICDEKA
jgi:enoyl-CoA hydratase/carnithine racemase